MSGTRGKLEFQVLPAPGHTAMDNADDWSDGIDLLIINDADSRRNVIVDDDAVAEVVRDLMDGRRDMAEQHRGYGSMWTLGIVSSSGRG